VFEIFKSMYAYFRIDPTQDWPIGTLNDLLFDLGNQCLNDIHFGDSFESLKRFGKPDNKKPFYYNVFQYFNKGLIIEIDALGIDYFGFLFENGGEPGFHPASVNMVFPPSRRLELSDACHIRSITDFLGHPEQIDKDEEEIILFYELNGMKIEFEMNLHEMLKRVNVYSTAAVGSRKTC